MEDDKLVILDQENYIFFLHKVKKCVAKEALPISKLPESDLNSILVWIQVLNQSLVCRLAHTSTVGFMKQNFEMIPEFFENTEIFITGGSGVVGSALIDKLLRSCNVRKIYLLLRPKKNCSIEQRLEKFKEAKIFRQLNFQKPNELCDKLEAIPGDAELPLLGISPECLDILRNVSIVFHCAATVRFDEPLKVALKLNVGGTLEALKFAETLNNLSVFMHVSTFYSNPYLKNVEPRYYDSPMDWKFCLNLIERDDLNEDDLNIITRKLIVGFPNTYTFTKNIAESLVNDYKSKLPVCIYRPSIVFFALEDPEPGFSPSLMGFMGLFAVVGAGLLKTCHIRNTTRLDMTPQDIGVKTMLYFALKASQKYEASKEPSEIPVYITSSCNYADYTLSNYVALAENNGIWRETAFEKNLLIPSIYCTNNRFVYMILVLFKQILPAILMDLLLKLFGRQPVLMAIQRKLFQTLEVMKPFMFNNFNSPGTTCYNEMLHTLKGTEFSINITEASNDLSTNLGFCRNMAYSVREILFKEDVKTLPRSRRILQIKIWVLRFLQFYLAYRLFLKIVQCSSSFLDNWHSENLNSSLAIN